VGHFSIDKHNQGVFPTRVVVNRHITVPRAGLQYVGVPATMI